MDLFWEMNNLLSTKEIIEMGIFKIFKQFSKERKTGDKQKIERIGERADP